MPTFAFAGGVSQVPGWGQRNRIRFVGTWAVGDTWSITFTTNLQGDFVIGLGDLANALYNSILVHDDRVFLANGTFWSFSAIGDSTKWEQQDVGAGFQLFTSSYGINDLSVSLAITQGRLAVFGRQNIQIWQIDADPSQFARVQVLQNAGTCSRNSVQSIGELDVLYLDDTGIRSLKTKEATLNAYVDDVGSAIDAIIQGVLRSMTESQKDEVVSVVEPESKRYWIYIAGKFYVLSQFPSSKVRAWSTYLPVDNSDPFNPFTFVPKHIKTFRGKVYIAHETGLFLVYGGLNGETYDYAVPTVDLPWISLEKPATGKQAKAIHAAFKGAWKIYASMQPGAAAMTEVVNRGSTSAPNSLTDSTYDVGQFPYSAYGSFVHLKAVGTAAAEAQTLSMLTLLYDDANKR